MQRIAPALCLLILAATVACSQSSDVAMIEAVNNAAAKLDGAFETDDAETIKALMTPNHVAVAPYYPGPQSVDEQIASLDDFDYAETDAGEPTVTLLGPDVALRTSTVTLKGRYKGKLLPTKAYATEVMVKRNGKWLEQFYQATTLEP